MAVRVALTKTAAPGPFNYAGIEVTLGAANVSTLAISAATEAANAVLTAAAHGLITGESISISGFTDGWTGGNGVKTVTVINANTFTIGLDSQGFGAMSGSPVIAGGNNFVLTGKEIVLAKNAHADTARTVTIVSVNDPYGRTKDMTAISIAAGKIYAFGPFTNRMGWLQSNGKMFLQGSTTDIKFAVLTIP
jgi:hypothetical protein